MPESIASRLDHCSVCPRQTWLQTVESDLPLLNTKLPVACHWAQISRQVYNSCGDGCFCSTRRTVEIMLPLVAFRDCRHSFICQHLFFSTGWFYWWNFVSAFWSLALVPVLFKTRRWISPAAEAVWTYRWDLNLLGAMQCKHVINHYYYYYYYY